MSKLKVKYETLPGWKSDTSHIRRREDLPRNAYNYLKFIEDNVGVPISWVGTGPTEDAMFEFH
jgi:adenylosuccinate synthase